MSARVMLAIVVILAIALPSAAARAKGWYHTTCDSAEIHLTTFPEHSSGEDLQLSLRTSFPGLNILLSQPDLWLGQISKVTGRRCDRAGRCSGATRADFQVTSQTKRRISGRYRMDFDGEHLEGEFLAHYRKGAQIVCE